MTEFNKSNPFPAKIKERILLSKEDSTKKTYHITLDLKGSNISYKVGDAIAILPENPPSFVHLLLSLLKKTGEEQVVDPRTNATLSLKQFFSKKVNLSRITSPLLKITAQNEPDPLKKAALENLLVEENKAERSSFIAENDVIDLIESHPHLSLTPIQELLSYFSPLLPRFYSIASSQTLSKDSVDLLVATFSYIHVGKKRQGIASQFLCEEAQIGKSVIPIYHHPTPLFTLPVNPNAPILMIGPGTGIAPYRGFLQERMFHKAKGENWLIFGERHRKADYYYERFLETAKADKWLRLDVAFSRDQKEKIYVQDKLYENKQRVWDFLEKNAYIYICGDARHMAKDVVAIFHKIIEEEGGLSPTQAKEYLKLLRRSKRFLMDVY